MLVVLVAAIVLISQLAGSSEGDVRVPDVVGMQVADATERLERADLRVEVQPVVNDEAAENEVVAQNPAADEEVEHDSTVVLDVNGAGEIDVPDVEGDPAADATPPCSKRPGSRWTPCSRAATRSSSGA